MARSLGGGTDDVHWTIAATAPAVGCVSFWMRTTQVTVNATVLTYWNSSSRLGWGVLLNNTANKLRALGYSSTSAERINLSSTSNVNDGNAHHIAFNYDRASGGANALYIDGVQEASGNSSASWTSAGTGVFMQSGDNVDAFWPSYVGEISEVAHWNDKLTADEIAALAKGFSPRLIRPTARFMHAPLVRDIHDLHGNTASATGGSVSVHPKVIGGTV